jgi:hypothetical protein
MLVPVINLLIGAALIVGGATGRLALFGTSSTGAAVAVGGVIAAFGLYQLVSAMRRRD